MTNIYNKGKYRSGEWAKHLRPYLKKVGNRKWRRTSKDFIILEDDENKSLKSFTKHKKVKKTLEVKFKLRYYGDITCSYRAKYRTLKAAKDAMKRKNIISAQILE